MKKKIVIGLAAFLLAAVAVAAWTPTSDINLRNYYDLINAVLINGTNITAIEHFIGNGSLLTDVKTYNATYDAKPDVDTDTNASTACSGTSLLDGSGSCVSVVDGWNRTDQGNTSLEVLAAANVTQRFVFTAQNATEVYNATYDAKPDNTYNSTYDAKPSADTNSSTACSDDEILQGDNSCLSLVDGWNRTDFGNTSAEIIAVASPLDTNASTACSGTEVLTGAGNCVSWPSGVEDTNASTACAADQLLSGDGTCVALSDGWNRTDQGNTSAEITAAVTAADTYVINTGDTMTGSLIIQGNLTLDGADRFLYLKNSTFSFYVAKNPDNEDAILYKTAQSIDMYLGAGGYFNVRDAGGTWKAFFDTSGNLNMVGHATVGDYVTATGYIRSASDIYTTGSGDDFWLGTTTQANANLAAYASGQLKAAGGEFNVNTTGSITEVEEVHLDDSEKIYFGDDKDVAMSWNGTHFVIESS